MTRLRHGLRVFVAAWLLFQAASLSALVPRDCCAAHRPAAAACHEPPPPAHCPMPAADGQRCPMHRGSDAPAHGGRCRLTGSCDGPMAALVTLLSIHGILSDAPALFHTPDAQRVGAVTAERLIGKLVPPEPPPPRA